jgi:hypothetical protein
MNARKRNVYISKIIYNIQVKLGLNSIKCNNVVSIKIKPLHVSAKDGHHRKATNTSKEMLHVYYMHMLLRIISNILK